MSDGNLALSNGVTRNHLRFACLGNYVPRQCGIATFTHDLCEAICQSLGKQDACAVVAINDTADGYLYPEWVCFEIQQQQIADYQLAAEFLNIRRPDLLLVQHEFGIFGGTAGSHLTTLLEKVRVPIVTTMHTVLHNPSDEYRQSTMEVIELSDKIVVMADRAMEILRDVYHVESHKLAMIPHGIPDLPFVDPVFYKDRFGVEGRKVMLTFGLLSPGKGIEHVISAMPALVKRHPDLVYVVLGATHPHIRRTSGEAYRHQLQRLAEDLDVSDNVLFLNRYVELSELCEYLGASDIYITPYLNQDQIVSGTLAYALGAGNAVVSTPYWHAKELLAEGRGCLVPFSDSAAIAERVHELLEDESLRQSIRKKAYLHQRSSIWKEVAKSYLEIFSNVCHQPTGLQANSRIPKNQQLPTQSLPELKLDHLVALTDDVGILQHARFSIPDRGHGYCVDDNARALIFSLEADSINFNSRLRRMAHVYLTFLQHAFNSSEGRFRNFMAYDRRWLEEIGSEDSHGRALWGLGVAVQLAPTDGFRAAAMRLFNDGLAVTESFTSPRAWAFSLLGINCYLQRFGGDSRVRQFGSHLGQSLFHLFGDNITEEWAWPEASLNYCNGVLPEALILTGHRIGDQEMLTMGLRTLEWLIKIKSTSPQSITLVGNKGWYPRDGEKADFDQQPINAHSLLRACLSAHQVTSQEHYLRQARRCLDWFLGRNTLGQVLCDWETGGCRDGLHSTGVNENQGAESTLAWLLSLVAMQGLKTKTKNLPEPHTRDVINSLNDHSTTPTFSSAAP